MKRKFLLLVLILLTIEFIFSINVLADTSDIGWKLVDGKWYYYYNEYGSKYINSKQNINGKYYCFDETGAMRSNGWYKDEYYYYGNDAVQTSTTWYYLNVDGSVATGWTKVGNAWYYFDSYGYMSSNTSRTINGKTYFFDASGVMRSNGWYEQKLSNNSLWYYLNSDGSAVTGWKKIGNVWYYFYNQGQMASNSSAITNNNKVYCFDKSGAMVTKTGWYQYSYNYSDGNYIVWHYLNKDNTAVTGWKLINGTWYYFDQFGKMLANTAREINGKIYAFNQSGAWIKPNGWFYSNSDYYGKTWFYFENGYGVKGWKKIKNVWYYFEENDDYGLVGSMADYSKTINNKVYCFNSSGAWIDVKNGWNKQIYKNYDGSNDVAWYYFENGNVVTRWKKINGIWYYFNTYNGRMVSNGMQYIDGKQYYFDASGAMKTNYWYKYTNTYTSNGKEYTNVNWYYFGEDGSKQIITGWQELEGDKYYFSENGYMYTNGRYTIDNETYFFENGKMLSNCWKVEKIIKNSKIPEVTTNYYFFKENGTAAKGWYDLEENTYFFYSNGLMACNTRIWNEDNIYGFDENGHMVKDDWLELKNSYWDNEKKETIERIDKYYFDEDGKGINGNYTIAGKEYYFNNGWVVVNSVIWIDNDSYGFNENNQLIKNGWLNDMYFDEDGKGASGLIIVDGDEYYFWKGSKQTNTIQSWNYNDYYGFDENGQMIKNGWLRIESFYWDDGGRREQEIVKEYYFGEDGKGLNGYHVVDENGYYFSNGWVVRNSTVYINEYRYGFDENNQMIKNGWLEEVHYYNFSGDEIVEERYKYYFGEDGKGVSGFITIDDDDYYFYYGKLEKDGLYYIDGYTYGFDKNGYIIRNGWFKEHYFGEDGKGINGFKEVDGIEYYFDSGAIVKNDYKWIEVNNYGFDSEGKMIKNDWLEKVEGYWDSEKEEYYEVMKKYYFGEDGAGVNGYKTIAGKEYYFENGWMVVNSVRWIEGKVYGFDDSNNIIKNDWLNYYNEWYYFDENGTGVNGYKTIGEKEYYFINGKMPVNCVEWIDGTYYGFDELNQMIKNDWFISSSSYHVFYEDGKEIEVPVKYYFGSDGAGVNGLIEIEGESYYFDGGYLIFNTIRYMNENIYGFDIFGKMIKNDWLKNGDNRYYFGPDGVGLNGYQIVEGKEYYFINGRMAGNCIEYIDGNYYGFDENGQMIKNGSFELNGIVYYFDEAGIALNGYHTIDGIEYYFLNGKILKNSIEYIDGNYYGFDESSHMIKNGWFESIEYYWNSEIEDYKERIAMYYFGEDGAGLNGLQIVDGKQYCFRNGYRVTNDMEYINENYYAFDSDGQMIKNDCFYDYYFGSDGAGLKGFHTIDGVEYYFVMGRISKNAVQYISGNYYGFDENGQIIKNSWFEKEGYDGEIHKYYFGADGVGLNGYNVVDGIEYYFYCGEMMTNSVMREFLKWYGVDENGKILKNSWLEYRDQWYYFGADGIGLKEWQEIDGYTYYFHRIDGYMLTGEQIIDGVIYNFGEDGRLIGEIVNDESQLEAISSVSNESTKVELVGDIVAEMIEPELQEDVVEEKKEEKEELKSDIELEESVFNEDENIEVSLDEDMSEATEIDLDDNNVCDDENSQKSEEIDEDILEQNNLDVEEEMIELISEIETE